MLDIKTPTSILVAAIQQITLTYLILIDSPMLLRGASCPLPQVFTRALEDIISILAALANALL